MRYNFTMRNLLYDEDMKITVLWEDVEISILQGSDTLNYYAEIIMWKCRNCYVKMMRQKKKTLLQKGYVDIWRIEKDHRQ